MATNTEIKKRKYDVEGMDRLLTAEEFRVWKAGFKSGLLSGKYDGRQELKQEIAEHREGLRVLLKVK